MRVLVTGMKGTVAPVTAARLQRDGHEIVAWDRSHISPDDLEAGRTFVREHKPDALLHFAMGSPEWAAMMAHCCREQDIYYLYVSSVSVFSSSQQGPFHIHDTPIPEDEYGRYKLNCETAVRAANPDALIARLGWQIGDTPGSNNMIHYFHERLKADGRIQASRRWYPSCAFLEDTAEQLTQLLTGHRTGLYQLEGNPGLTFYDLATALARHHQASWIIEPTETPAWDNRMVDERVVMRSVSDHLDTGTTPPRA